MTGLTKLWTPSPQPLSWPPPQHTLRSQSQVLALGPLTCHFLLTMTLNLLLIKKPTAHWLRGILLCNYETDHQSFLHPRGNLPKVTPCLEMSPILPLCLGKSWSSLKHIADHHSKKDGKCQLWPTFLPSSSPKEMWIVPELRVRLREREGECHR